MFQGERRESVQRFRGLAGEFDIGDGRGEIVSSDEVGRFFVPDESDVPERQEGERPTGWTKIWRFRQERCRNRLPVDRKGEPGRELNVRYLEERDSFQEIRVPLLDNRETCQDWPRRPLD